MCGSADESDCRRDNTGLFMCEGQDGYSNDGPHNLDEYITGLPEAWYSPEDKADLRVSMLAEAAEYLGTPSNALGEGE